MFPLPWNKAYRKKDGSLTTLDDAIKNGGGGGGSDLPDYDSSDAGKVLAVGLDGTLEWVTPSSSGTSVGTNTSINTDFSLAQNAADDYDVVTNAEEVN